MERTCRLLSISHAKEALPELKRARWIPTPSTIQSLRHSVMFSIESIFNLGAHERVRTSTEQTQVVATTSSRTVSLRRIETYA